MASSEFTCRMNKPSSPANEENDTWLDHTPEELCMEGDELLRKERYVTCLEFYNRAIALEPTNAEYYIKRAKCFIRMLLWEEALEDSHSAVLHDPENPHSFYSLAMAYNVKRKFPEAKEAIEKAHELAALKEIDLGDELKKWIYASHYFLSYDTLPEEEKKKREVPQDENKFCVKRAIKLLENRLKKKLEVRQRAMPYKKAEYEADFKKRISRVKTMYQIKGTRKIDDHLLCNLSTGFMIHPVTGPSGHSYEKDAILHHLKNVGQFDPITLEPLSEEKLVRNEALEDEAEYYLSRNPWAKKIYENFSLL